MNLRLPENISINNLQAIEKATLLYCLITSLLMLYMVPSTTLIYKMIGMRLGVVIFTYALSYTYRFFPNKFMIFFRILFQMALLSYWYSETFEFNRYFSNQDYLLAITDQRIFGSQPAWMFSQQFHQGWFSELCYMGYFAYYPMIICVVIYHFFFRYESFTKISYLITASFFVYYLIFILFPVAGPQFYYPAIGFDNTLTDNFPAINDYFNIFDKLPETNEPLNQGLFNSMVTHMQHTGERPTAAFPSSHVGISTILMIITRKSNKNIFFALIPFYIFLCLATVYIKAHYLIDSLAGFVSAFLVYSVVLWIFNYYFRKKYPHIGRVDDKTNQS